MPKGAKQKLKLYYLGRIMLDKTDDEHALTMEQIRHELALYGVSADRKSLYDDFEALRVLGIDVIGEKCGHSYTYHVGKKPFDVAECKLLVDAVQSSKFITEKKSSELIRKLTDLVSHYEARQLKRQVVVKGRVKTMNESIYYIVDDIHRAIEKNRKISFEYMRWNLQKKMERRRLGLYTVSPWALTWDDENYYLIAFDEEEKIIKHYRVDKMKKITVLDDLRDGLEDFEKFGVASYMRMSFGMFGGKKTSVRIAFRDDLVGVFIDRFGKDIPIYPFEREGWSVTRVDVALSAPFYGWLFGLGDEVELVSPDEAVTGFRNALKKVSMKY